MSTKSSPGCIGVITLLCEAEIMYEARKTERKDCNMRDGQFILLMISKFQRQS